MKSGVSILVAIILVTSLSSLTQAATLSFGFRYWSSSWTIDNQVMENPRDTGPSSLETPSFVDPIDNIDISGIGLFGGALTLSFTQRLSLTATVMAGKFDFDIKNNARWDFEPGSEYDYYESDFEITQSVQRYDLDFSLQYKLSQNATAFFGYKRLDYSFDKQQVERESRWVLPNGQYMRFVGQTTIDAYSVGYHGPGFGAMGYYLIPTTNFIYYGTVGVLPYLMSTGDVQERLGDDDTGWAFNGEVGVGYTSPDFPLIPMLGYKYQMFSGFGDMEEVFHGFTFGLSYNLSL